jgi:hypothetical protein
MAAALSKVFTSGDHDFHEVAVRGPNGHSRWFSNHVGPVRSGSQITAAVVISQDVTKTKLAQTELAERVSRSNGVAGSVAWPVRGEVKRVRRESALVLSRCRGMFLQGSRQPNVGGQR